MRGRIFSVALIAVFFVLVLSNIASSHADLPVALADHFNGTSLNAANWSRFGNGTISVASSYVSIRNGTNGNVTGIVSVQQFAIGNFIFQGNFTGSVAFGLVNGTAHPNGILFKSNETGLFREVNSTTGGRLGGRQGSTNSSGWILVSGFLNPGMHTFRIVWSLNYVSFYVDALGWNETGYVPLVNLRLVAMVMHSGLMLDYVSVGSYLVQATSTVTQTSTSTSFSGVAATTTTSTGTVTIASSTSTVSSQFTETDWLTSTTALSTLTIQGVSTYSVFTGVVTVTAAVTETDPVYTTTRISSTFTSSQISTAPTTLTTYIVSSQIVTATSTIHTSSQIVDTVIHVTPTVTSTRTTMLGGLGSAPEWVLLLVIPAICAVLVGPTFALWYVHKWRLHRVPGARREGNGKPKAAPKKDKAENPNYQQNPDWDKENRNGSKSHGSRSSAMMSILDKVKGG